LQLVAPPGASRGGHSPAPTPLPRESACTAAPTRPTLNSPAQFNLARTHASLPLQPLAAPEFGPVLCSKSGNSGKKPLERNIFAPGGSALDRGQNGWRPGGAAGSTGPQAWLAGVGWVLWRNRGANSNQRLERALASATSTWRVCPGIQGQRGRPAATRANLAV